MRDHPLDCPIWAALTTAQAHFAEGGAFARRFRQDISPFFAAIDDTPGAVAALRDLIGTGDELSLLERAPPAPPAGVALKMNAAGIQMICESFTAGGRHVAFELLGDSDAADMLELALLTRPGPFRAATHKLGRFIGVRDNGHLVAMAGERLQTEEFIEISAVCTHPDHRGRGYGGALMRAVGARILADGKTPFLHSYANNTTAIALYRSLGFEHRCDVVHAVWTHT